MSISYNAERRENMLWFRVPEKVYIKKGCLPVALDELKTVRGAKKAFIVTDTFLDYGIDEEKFLSQLDEMTEQAFDDQCTGANPRYPLMSEIKQMYLNAYYGDKHFVEEDMPKA